MFSSSISLCLLLELRALICSSILSRALLDCLRKLNSTFSRILPGKIEELAFLCKVYSIFHKLSALDRENVYLWEYHI